MAFRIADKTIGIIAQTTRPRGAGKSKVQGHRSIGRAIASGFPFYYLVLEIPDGNLSNGMWKLNGTYTERRLGSIIGFAGDE
jgi:hypothetical protein